MIFLGFMNFTINYIAYEVSRNRVGRWTDSTVMLNCAVCVGADQPKPQFYVYCKDPCKGLKPGKLRVRCADCKQSTLLLDQEPGGWDDVLKPRCIRGRCQHQGCRGIYAVRLFFSCCLDAFLPSVVYVLICLATCLPVYTFVCLYMCVYMSVCYLSLSDLSVVFFGILGVLFQVCCTPCWWERQCSPIIFGSDKYTPYSLYHMWCRWTVSGLSSNN